MSSETSFSPMTTFAVINWTNLIWKNDVIWFWPAHRQICKVTETHSNLTIWIKLRFVFWPKALSWKRVDMNWILQPFSHALHSCPEPSLCFNWKTFSGRQFFSFLTMNSFFQRKRKQIVLPEGIFTILNAQLRPNRILGCFKMAPTDFFVQYVLNQFGCFVGCISNRHFTLCWSSDQNVWTLLRRPLFQERSQDGKCS